MPSPDDRATASGFTATAAEPEALALILDRCLELGATAAELPVSELRLVRGGALDRERAAAVAAVAAARPLAFSVHAPDVVNFFDSALADRHRAVFESTLAFAGMIGARTVVLHPGRHPAALPAAEVARRAAQERDTVRSLADSAAAIGAVIGMETMDPAEDTLAGTMVDTGMDPGGLAAQVRAIDHPAVGIVLDVGHLAMSATDRGFDPVAAARGLGPLVCHLHLHDNFALPPLLVSKRPTDAYAYGTGDLHLPLGHGTVPIGAMLADLPVRAGTLAILELPERFGSFSHAAQSLAIARRLVSGLRPAAAAQAA